MAEYPPVWQPNEPPPQWEAGGREKFAHICYMQATDGHNPIQERRFWGSLLRGILPTCDPEQLPKRIDRQ